MATRQAPSRDLPHASGLTHPGLCLVLVQYFQSNAFLHRAILTRGQFEFVLQAIRADVLGLGTREYAWVFRALARTQPLDLTDLPDGTILDDHGHVVPLTKDDLIQADAMTEYIRTRPQRLFL